LRRRKGEIMTTPNWVLYALNTLGPSNIQNELQNMRTNNFTTIIIGMIHIGNHGDTLGDIIFNGGEPTLISNGKIVFSGAQAWANQIAQLKGGGSPVTKVYVSFGGGDTVVDFSTIKAIYENNGNSFEGTVLKKNLEIFRQVFRDNVLAFDGVDMDCEDVYDLPSFVAFCEMMIGFGFSITFCPFVAQSDFWTPAQQQLEAKHPGIVKWWNLQCYAGGGDNTPGDWTTPSMPDGFLIPGDWVRFWNPNPPVGWMGDCPTAMQAKFAGPGFKKQRCVGGGFVWDLDLVRDTMNQKGRPDNGCGLPNAVLYASLYQAAMKEGLGWA